MDEPPPRCRLSDPAHPHFLSRRDNPPPSECFGCGPDGKAFKPDKWHYYCDVCEVVFHKSCRYLVTGIRHPYHLEHLLSMTFQISEIETRSFNTQAEIHQYLLKEDFSLSKSRDGCDWCGEKLREGFYRCLFCGFSLGDSCIKKDPPLTITNPKSHQHPLNLFPRPLSVLCNACGLSDKNKDDSDSEDENEEPGYVCLPCNYFVHESCIDLPRVIKLTRHPHRLSLTSYLPPPANRSCGVCQRNIDVKRGMYSCNKGCPYAIHSMCATHKYIWDGIDLEGVPEEPEEDLSPYVEVGYNLIKHFSHEHHLKFDEDEFIHDAAKECQACCRPIDLGGFYGCTILHCDFYLHTPCANFPKKKEQPVHIHPLTLIPAISNARYMCAPCGRWGSGFSYKCLNDSCNEHPNYRAMDVGCASVCEPFEHKAHPHPLFLFSGKNSSSLCRVCGKERESIYTVSCNDCRFSMCFNCATIPVLIRYKHDEHLLTLSTGEDSSDPYWCERCEREINPKKWFYTCNECCTTLHINCVFEDSSFMKIGSKFEFSGYELTFATNFGNSRPLCNVCGVRCLYSGVFKGKDVCICSEHCLRWL